MMRQLPLFPGVLPRALTISDQAMHVQDAIHRLVQSKRPTTTIMAFGVSEALGMLKPSDSASSRSITVDKINIGYTPKRMNIFKHSHRCVCCGREATVALVERASTQKESGMHALALYIVDGDNFIPLTVDHVLLDCMGGQYATPNLRTMCLECNSRRADQMSDADIEMIRAAPRLYVKERISIEWLLHTLGIAEQYNKLVQVGSRKQIAMKRQELITARSFLKQGKVPPAIPGTQIIPTPNPWVVWWNSMPSIWPSVYGWVADRHDWFMLPQLFVR